jgi:carboxyl-terminal processing protease
VLREGHSGTLDLKITRAHVEFPDVTWRMLPGIPIAHIAIQDFGLRVDERLRIAVNDARGDGARALVLDLRANSGGLRDQAVAVTSEFIAKGLVFIEQNAKGERKDVPVHGSASAPDIPICLLIDDGTASAAEIFAGAVQDHRRGKLVGTHTFGTGTVLQPFHLSDGSAVLLAVAEWLTPSGRQIWHQGVAPDYEVTLPEGATVVLADAEPPLTTLDLAQSSDAQLLKGIEVLKKQIDLAQAPR